VEVIDKAPPAKILALAPKVTPNPVSVVRPLAPLSSLAVNCVGARAEEAMFKGPPLPVITILPPFTVNVVPASMLIPPLLAVAVIFPPVTVNKSLVPTEIPTEIPETPPAVIVSEPGLLMLLDEVSGVSGEIGKFFGMPELRVTPFPKLTN